MGATLSTFFGPVSGTADHGGGALDFSGASSVLGSATGTYSDGVVDTHYSDQYFARRTVSAGGMGFSGVGDLSGSTLTSDGSVTSGTIHMNRTLTGILVAATQAVPEPETLAMLLAGLGLVEFRCRRSDARAHQG